MIKVKVFFDVSQILLLKRFFLILSDFYSDNKIKEKIMTVRLQEINDIVLLHLEGDFTLNFIPIFIDLINTITQKNKNKLLINLEKVYKMDSSSLGSLIATTSTLEQNGASLKVLNLSPQVKRIFNFNYIQDYIEVYSDQKLAVTAFSKRSL